MDPSSDEVASTSSLDTFEKAVAGGAVEDDTVSAALSGKAGSLTVDGDALGDAEKSKSPALQPSAAVVEDPAKEAQTQRKTIQELSVKVKELQATESKLTRLLQLAKRSIENSKRELQEKDRVIEKHREEIQAAKAAATIQARDRSAALEPRKIHQRVQHAGALWCLIEYIDSEAAGRVQPELVWKKFSTEAELEAFIGKKKSGEPLVCPPPSLTVAEAEEVRANAQKEVDKVKEEFRRYRVRAEILRKQKEAEIQKIQASTMAAAQQKIAGADLTAELESARQQIRRLAKLQDEFDDMEATWKQRLERSEQEVARLKSAAGEASLAAEWRERYENLQKERDDLLAKVGHLNASTSVGAESAEEKLDRLRREYNSYRKNAMDVIREREEALQAAKRQLESAGLQFVQPAAPGPEAGRRTSTSAFNALSLEEQKRYEYLKNIVLNYMSASEMEVKEHMEGAIATVLQFSPQEVELVKRGTDFHARAAFPSTFGRHVVCAWRYPAEKG